MDNNQIKKKYGELLSYGKRWSNYRCYAEDFAQEAIIEIVRGRKASSRQLYIDFLRKHFTDTRAIRKLKKPYKRSNFGLEYDDSSLHEESECIGQFSRSSSRGNLLFEREDWRRGEWFKKIEIILDHQETIVWKLYFSETMNARQMSDVLGVTESRISQMLKAIHKKAAKLQVLEQVT